MAAGSPARGHVISPLSRTAFIKTTPTTHIHGLFQSNSLVGAVLLQGLQEYGINLRVTPVWLKNTFSNDKDGAKPQHALDQFISRTCQNWVNDILKQGTCLVSIFQQHSEVLEFVSNEDGVAITKGLSDCLETPDTNAKLKLDILLRDRTWGEAVAIILRKKQPSDPMTIVPLGKVPEALKIYVKDQLRGIIQLNNLNMELHNLITQSSEGEFRWAIQLLTGQKPLTSF